MKAMLFLAWAELRMLRREWVGVLSMLAVAVLLGVAPYATRAISFESDTMRNPDLDPAPVDLSCEDVRVEASLAGTLPPWMVWPFEESTDPTVLVRSLGGQPPAFEVVALEPAVEAQAMAVRGCLWEQIRAQQDERLGALGLPERPGWVAQVTWWSGGDPREIEYSEFGMALLSATFLVVLGVFADLIPRARSSGFLEALVVAPRHPIVIVGAWWLTAVIAALVGIGVSGGSHVGLAYLLDLEVKMVSPVVVLTAVGCVSACTILPFSGVGAARAAVVRSVPYMMVLLALTGLAVAVELSSGLGAVVPIGGILAAAAGLVGNPALAVFGGVTLTIGLLFIAALQLERLDPSSFETGARRRWARGDYVPEVLFLFLVGISGSSTWLPAFLGSESAVAGILIGQVMFMVVPGMIAWPLALDVRELLSLRWPRWRALWWTPVAALGAVSIVLVLFGSTGWLLSLAERGYQLRVELMSTVSFPVALVVLAVVPAICEELIFRGSLLGLLRRGMGPGAAVLIQAMLFAMAQILGFKLIPSFFLGIFLGLITVRTGSIAPAIYVRVAVNAAVLQSMPNLPRSIEQVTPVGWAILAGLSLVGLAALWKSGPPPVRSSG